MNVQLLIALGIVLALAFLTGRIVFAAVRSACGAHPLLRPLSIAGAGVVLAAVAWAIPRLGDLEPPYSESPSGLFVIAGRLLVVFFGSVAALATLAAALTPARS